jgi:excisionase family DNA binding protein
MQTGSLSAFYTHEEAATILRVSKTTCYEMLRSGEIPSKRAGAKWLIPKVAFEEKFGIRREEKPAPTVDPVSIRIQVIDSMIATLSAERAALTAQRA